MECEIEVKRWYIYFELFPENLLDFMCEFASENYLLRALCCKNSAKYLHKPVRQFQGVCVSV